MEDNQNEVYMDGDFFKKSTPIIPQTERNNWRFFERNAEATVLNCLSVSFLPGHSFNVKP